MTQRSRRSFFWVGTGKILRPAKSRTNGTPLDKEYPDRIDAFAALNATADVASDIVTWAVDNGLKALVNAYPKFKVTPYEILAGETHGSLRCKKLTHQSACHRTSGA